jgi:GT2 family glycosyltransferase
MTVPLAGLVLDYRDIARTRACVESLRAAGVAHVQVWDNTEGARAAPETYGFGDDGVVRVAGTGRNLGFAAGANRGIALCRETWPGCRVLLVNNDALVPPLLPQRLAEALDADNGAAIAFPSVRQHGASIGWMWYQPWFALVTRRPLPGAMAYASGCCQLIDPALAGEAPFDEGFFMYGEDVALAVRLRSEGRTQRLVESEEVTHEGSASSRNGSLFYESMLVGAHMRLATIFAGGRRARLLTLFLLRMLVLPLRALVRCVRFRNLVPLRALIAVRS